MQLLLGKSRALLITELVPLMARMATMRGMVPHGSMTQAYAGMRKYLDKNWEQLVAEALHKLYGPDRDGRLPDDAAHKMFCKVLVPDDDPELVAAIREDASRLVDTVNRAMLANYRVKMTLAGAARSAVLDGLVPVLMTVCNLRGIRFRVPVPRLKRRCGCMWTMPWSICCPAQCMGCTGIWMPPFGCADPAGAYRQTAGAG